jgi:centractin
VTEALAALLRRAGVPLRTSAERETVRAMKEACAYVAASPAAAEGAARDGAAPAAEYRLPDGQVLRLAAERFRAPEVLFTPALAGLETPGCSAALLAALSRTDLDLRAPLLGSLVLAGGSTATPGFAARVLAEVRRGAPPDARVRVWAPAERKVLTWLGGSILASLATFRKMCVTREEWEEEGPAALHRRGALL